MEPRGGEEPEEECKLERVAAAIRRGEGSGALFLAAGEVNREVGSTGRKLLDIAAECGHTSDVITLMSMGAQINGGDDQGYTALHYAAANGQTEVVRLLIDSGLSPNVQNKRSATPLHLAAAKGQVECVRELSVLGADVNAPDMDQFSPLHFAAASSCLDAVQVLVDLSAEVDAEGAYGVTPLMNAAFHGHQGAVALLIRLGADPLKANHRGSTAWEIAATKGHDKVSEMLEMVTLKGDIPMESPADRGASTTRSARGRRSPLSPWRSPGGAGVDRLSFFTGRDRGGYSSFSDLLNYFRTPER